MSLKNSLFSPAHVAIIGASDDPGKTTGRPIAFLQQHGFSGKITPVNPNRPTVGGLPAVKSLRDADGKVDHAFILTQGNMVEQAIDDCIAMGVHSATLLASGFAEAGDEGLLRQQRLVAKARNHGLRLLGPNSIGQVNTANGFTCTANAAFRIDHLIKGRLALLSQSGSMIGGILSRAQARGIGFSKLASVGNEADLSVGEIGALLADDPETDAFVLFLESIRAPEHMEAFAAACAKRNKPIVAFKLGRSKLGQEMSVSHTGAMIGSDRLDGCFLADLGIHRLSHFEALFEIPSLLTRQRSTQTEKPVAVVTTTGGGAALVVDQLGVLGVDVGRPSAALTEKLQQAIPFDISPGRILDLTLAGVRYDVMSAVLNLLSSSGEFSLVLAVIGSSAQFQPERAVKPLVDSAGKLPTPLVAFLTPDADESLGHLAAAGVPAFRTPEVCAEAIAAYLKAPKFRASATNPDAALPDPGTARLSEASALDALASRNIEVARRKILPLNSKGQDAEMRFPLVAKIVSADIPHKSDIGGVVLGIQNDDALEDAISSIKQKVGERAPSAKLEGILLQEMISGLAEMIVGFQRTSTGGYITVGAGGVMTELMQDLTVRRAPVDEAGALDMIKSLRSAALLQGYRGMPKGDIAALAKLIARFSETCAASPWIAEAEINPVIVQAEGKGACAVDALIVASRSGPGH